MVVDVRGSILNATFLVPERYFRARADLHLQCNDHEGHFSCASFGFGKMQDYGRSRHEHGALEHTIPLHQEIGASKMMKEDQQAQLMGQLMHRKSALIRVDCRTSCQLSKGSSHSYFILPRNMLRASVRNSYKGSSFASTTLINVG